MQNQSVLTPPRIRCPFHPDGTPTLNVYPTPVRGWDCFGAAAGMTFDLAAEVWARPRAGLNSSSCVAGVF